MTLLSAVCVLAMSDVPICVMKNCAECTIVLYALVSECTVLYTVEGVITSVHLLCWPATRAAVSKRSLMLIESVGAG